MLWKVEILWDGEEIPHFYTFNTESELDCFMEGVKAALGYVAFTILNDWIELEKP